MTTVLTKTSRQQTIREIAINIGRPLTTNELGDICEAAGVWSEDQKNALWRKGRNREVYEARKRKGPDGNPLFIPVVPEGQTLQDVQESPDSETLQNAYKWQQLALAGFEDCAMNVEKIMTPQLFADHASLVRFVNYVHDRFPNERRLEVPRLEY